MVWHRGLVVKLYHGEAEVDVAGGLHVGRSGAVTDGAVHAIPWRLGCGVYEVCRRHRRR